MKSNYYGNELNYNEYIICPYCGERIYGGISVDLVRCPSCGKELNGYK